MTDTKTQHVKPILCAALGNIIWGFSFLFTKVGLAVAPNPNVMLAHRFSISAILMALFLLTGKARISFKGKNFLPVFFLLLMQVCYYLFETYGLLYSNTTIAGLVLAVVPVVTIATGALFLKEYPSRRQILFCIMPVVGVIIMTVSGQKLGAISPLGILFLLLTVLSSAFYKTANRRAAEEFSAFERTFFILTASSVVFSVVGMKSVNWDAAAFFAPLLQGEYLFAVLGLSLLCSIAANLLVNYASGKMPVFKVSSFGSLSTLCSFAAGVLFLNESVNLDLILGAVLILVGIRLVTKPQETKASPQA